MDKLSISIDVKAEWFVTNERFHYEHVSRLEAVVKKKEKHKKKTAFLSDQMTDCVVDLAVKQLQPS